MRPDDTTNALLRQIRDQITSRGSDDRPGMPTAHRGVEVPLIMADPVIAPIDLVGRGPDWQPLNSFDVHHYTLGEVLVSIDSAKPTGIVLYAAEIRVYGVVLGQSDLLAVGVANNGTGPLRVPLPIGSAYARITVDARQLVNGVPSSLNHSDASMAGAMLQATIQSRIYR